MRHPKRLLRAGIATTAVLVASASPAFGAASDDASCVGQIISDLNAAPGPSIVGPTISDYNRTRDEFDASRGEITSRAARRDDC